MTLHWHPITDTKHKLLSPVFELYDASFPLEVREPHHILLGGIERQSISQPSAFHFLVGHDEDKQIVAFSTAHYLADVNVGFIVYILVNPNLQSRGVGALVHEQMRQLLQQDARRAGHASLRGIILESEREDCVHTEAERLDCQRRGRFFTRLGYRQAEAFYLQPPLQPNDATTVPLNLFVRLEEGQPPLADNELREIVLAMYEEKYHRVNQIPRDVLASCAEQFRSPAP